MCHPVTLVLSILQMTSTNRASLEGRDAPLIPDDCQQHTLRVSQRLCNIVDLGRKKRKSPDTVDEEEMRKRLKGAQARLGLEFAKTLVQNLAFGDIKTSVPD
jgi:hypothetical protein